MNGRGGSAPRTGRREPVDGWPRATFLHSLFTQVWKVARLLAYEGSGDDWTIEDETRRYLAAAIHCRAEVVARPFPFRGHQVCTAGGFANRQVTSKHANAFRGCRNVVAGPEVARSFRWG